MLRQINQSQKRTNDNTKNPRGMTRASSEVKFTERENRTEVAGGSWGDNGESLFNRHRISALQREKISGDRLCNCECT